MFGYRSQRFPFRAISLLALGFWLASLIGSGGGALVGGLGFLFLLPFLLFKMFLIVMFFGFIKNVAFGIGHDGFGHGRWPEKPRRRGPSEPDPKTAKEHEEWREQVRRARQELDDLFPDD